MGVGPSIWLRRRKQRPRMGESPEEFIRYRAMLGIYEQGNGEKGRPKNAAHQVGGGEKKTHKRNQTALIGEYRAGCCQ